MSSLQSVEFLDVAIVGAGFYGLKAARTYLALEPETKLAIFDGDDSVGGVWSKKRIYPHLMAQVEFGYFEYPDASMSEEGKPTNNLITGPMVQRYLEKYASDHDLMERIHCKSWVESIERSPRGWRLKINGNYVESAKLILATGITSVPNRPPFEIQSGAKIIHTKHIGNRWPELEDAKSVVVVGAAKSGYDAAYLMCKLGKRVTWVIRPNGGGPMPIMPAEIGGKNAITAGLTRLMSYLSPSLYNTKTFLGGFLHRTAMGRWLTSRYWTWLTNLTEKSADFGGNTSALKPDMSEQNCFWCDASLGLVTTTDFWSTLKSGNLRVLRENVSTVEPDSAVLSSGERVPCDYLLNATGWGDHFGFFSPKLKKEAGIPVYGANGSDINKTTSFWAELDLLAEAKVNKALPLLAAGPRDRSMHPQRIPIQRRWRLYNRCVPFEDACSGDRSLVVLGQLHTTQTPTIAEVQSLWAVAYLLGEVPIPDKEGVMQEIAEFLAWNRTRYLGLGERYPVALFDWIGYVDQLLKDLNVESRRKSSFVKEFLEPHGPDTYRGCLEEYLAMRKQVYHGKAGKGSIYSDDDYVVQ